MPYADPTKQKAAQQASYLKHKAVVVERSKQTRLANREWFEALKRSPCVECSGSFHPIQMDFHHRNGEEKLFPLGNSISKYGRDRILAEIAKCDLLCANCHRLRHLDRECYR